MTATVNTNASGIWATRVGTVLEYIGRGSNAMQAEVRYPEDKKTFILPRKWLDVKEDV